MTGRSLTKKQQTILAFIKMTTKRENWLSALKGPRAAPAARDAEKKHQDTYRSMHKTCFDPPKKTGLGVGWVNFGSLGRF
jgi:hypothetical protein